MINLEIPLVARFAPAPGVIQAGARNRNPPQMVTFLIVWEVYAPESQSSGSHWRHQASNDVLAPLSWVVCAVVRIHADQGYRQSDVLVAHQASVHSPKVLTAATQTDLLSAQGNLL